MAKVQLRRGSESRRSQVTPQPGEPLVSLDTKELHIGDGTTAGGFPVGTVKTTGQVSQGNLAVFNDATGRVLKGVSKSSLLTGYATEKYVGDKIAAESPNIKVNKAVLADTATNAEALEGKKASEFLSNTSITDNYTLTSSSKVLSASGANALYTTLNQLITGLRNSKLDKTSIADNLSTTDSSKVLSAYQGKLLSDQIALISGDSTGSSSTIAQLQRDIAEALRESKDASAEAANAVSTANAAINLAITPIPQFAVARSESEAQSVSNRDPSKLYIVYE